MKPPKIMLNFLKKHLSFILLLVSLSAAADDSPAGKKENIQEIFPESLKTEKIVSGNHEYRTVIGRDSKLIGYAFDESVRGFGGPITCRVYIDSEGKLRKIIAVDASGETPEYGGRCMKESWLDQFIGHTAATIPENKYEFEDYGLDCITGATISSTAITSCLRNAFSKLPRRK